MEVIKCPNSNCDAPNIYVHIIDDEGVIYFKCDNCDALFKE